jgi:hypothetical protein
MRIAPPLIVYQIECCNGQTGASDAPRDLKSTRSLTAIQDHVIPLDEYYGLVQLNEQSTGQSHGLAADQICRARTGL